MTAGRSAGVARFPEVPEGVCPQGVPPGRAGALRVGDIPVARGRRAVPGVVFHRGEVYNNGVSFRRGADARRNGDFNRSAALHLRGYILRRG